MEAKQFTSTVKPKFNRKRIQTNNIRNQVVQYAADKPQGMEQQLFLTLIDLAQKEGIEQIDDWKVEYHEDVKKGTCNICGENLTQHGTRFHWTCNGQRLAPGHSMTAGYQCWAKMIKIAEGSRYKNFQMYKDKPRAIDPLERVDRARVPLKTLPKKALKKIIAHGISPDEEIVADAIAEIQRDIIRKDDFSGLERLIDPGQYRGMISWLTAQDNEQKIYDGKVRRAAALVLEHPEALSKADWNRVFLYAWQERKFKTEDELGNDKQNIEFLLKIYEEHAPDSPETKLIEKFKEHGKIGKRVLTQNLKPVKVLDKAEWEKVNLQTILERSAITKAQARAARNAIPQLHARQAYYNAEVMKTYGELDDLERIFSDLDEMLVTITDKPQPDKRQGLKFSQSWDARKQLIPFFESLYRKRSTGETTTITDFIRHHITMPEVQKTVGMLYVEAKKVQLAKEWPEFIPETYIRIQDAERFIPKLGKKLEKLAESAIEFGNLPEHTRQKLRNAGFARYDDIEPVVRLVSRTRKHDIIPLRLLRDTRLERLLNMMEAYQESEETAQQITYLRMLETSFAGLVIKNRSAEDGSANKNTTEVKFCAKDYEGKRFFTQEQRAAIAQVMNYLPEELKGWDEHAIKRAEQAQEYLKGVYDRYTIYSHTHPDAHSDALAFYKEEMPVQRLSDKARTYFEFQPVKALLERMQNIEKRYTIITPKLRTQLQTLRTEKAQRYFINKIRLPPNLDEILGNEQVLITQHLSERINSFYTEFTAAEEKAKQNREELAQHGYDAARIGNIVARLGQLEQEQRRPWLPLIPGEFAGGIWNTKPFLANDMKAIPLDYIKQVEAAIETPAMVIPQGIEHYRDTTKQYFDVLAIADPREHMDQWKWKEISQKMSDAFKRRPEEAHALLKWTDDRTQKMGEHLLYRRWHKFDMPRAELDEAIKRAYETREIYLKIVAAR